MISRATCLNSYQRSNNSMESTEVPHRTNHRRLITKKFANSVVIVIISVTYVGGAFFIYHSESRMKSKQPEPCKPPCDPPPKPGADGIVKVAAGSSGSQTTSSRLNCSQKLILAWTSFFSDPLENYFSDQYLDKRACRSSCRISSDKKLIQEAAVVLFHARDMDFSAFPKFRTAAQLWTVFNLEPPVNAGINQRYDGMFNLTMTYRRDSDIPVPYGYYVPSRMGAQISSSALEGMSRRKPVYWLVNNCVQRRMDYALQLAKHIEVDIIGRCSGRITCTPGGSCESSLSSTYAFYLSFENINCPDYITEKLWKVLKSPGGAIPVVMGASLSDYEAVAPPDSFIHVDNFTSPQELATFLKKVMSSADLSLYYHRWREKYTAFQSDWTPASYKLCDVAQRGAQTSDKGRSVSAWFNKGCS